MMEWLVGIGSVFMLHRVCPYDANALVYNENMKLSPNELSFILETELEKGRKFISVDELTSVLNKKKRYNDRFIVITLDDGYRDNLEFGLPIFKKYNVPFCIYVTNCFPNRTTNLWWYALEELILQNQMLTTATGEAIPNHTMEQKKRNFMSLRQIILEREFIDPMKFLLSVGDLSFSVETQREQKCLTWDEIAYLNSENLVTIGCHTMNHYPLSRLSDEKLQAEIEDSKNELAERLGKPIRHFAFPFGSRNECHTREYAAAEEAGFDSIATTIHGHIYRGDNAKQLDRIFVYPLQNNNTTLDKILYWNARSYYALAKKALLK